MAANGMKPYNHRIKYSRTTGGPRHPHFNKARGPISSTWCNSKEQDFPSGWRTTLLLPEVSTPQVGN